MFEPLLTKLIKNVLINDKKDTGGTMGKTSTLKNLQRGWEQITSALDKLPENVSGIINSKINPIVMIGVYRESVGARKHMFRSVGFISEFLGPQLRLVTTCKHTMTSFKDIREFGEPLVVANNPLPSFMEVVGDPILDLQPEIDVAFLIVRDKANTFTRRMKILENDPAIITDWTILYNASSRTLNPFNHNYNLTVNKQYSGIEMQKAYVKLDETASIYVMLDESERQKELLEQGYGEYRLFVNMISESGYSGSPIFGKNFELYGLNARGVTPECIEYPDTGPMVLCVPTSEIYKSRQRIDTELQKRLKSLK